MITIPLRCRLQNTMHGASIYCILILVLALHCTLTLIWIVNLQTNARLENLEFDMSVMADSLGSLFCKHSASQVAVNRFSPQVAISILAAKSPQQILNTARNSRKKTSVQEEICIKYDRVDKIADPLFTYNSNNSSWDEDIFLANPLNKDLLAQTRQAQEGHIRILSNGYIHLNTCCEYSNSVEDHMKPVIDGRYVPDSTLPTDVIFVPLVHRDLTSYPLFFDGMLPRLALLGPAVLRWPQLRLLLHPDVKDPKIFELLEFIGVARDRIVFVADHSMRVPVLLSVCATPAFHPAAWRAVRSLLGASPSIPPPDRGAKPIVVLITRNMTLREAVGGGRIVRNVNANDSITWFLKRRYGVDHVRQMWSSTSLAERRAMCHNASIVIGVHGNELQSSALCGQSALVVEIMPLVPSPDGRPRVKHGLVEPAVLLRTTALGQKYVRFYESDADYNGNVRVNVTRLELVLDEVDVPYRLRKSTPRHNNTSIDRRHGARSP